MLARRKNAFLFVLTVSVVLTKPLDASTSPPSSDQTANTRPPPANIDDLKWDLDAQSQQLDVLRHELEAKDAQIKSLQDETDKIEKDKSWSVEDRSFWLTTSLTLFTLLITIVGFIATIYGVYLAIRQLINFEKNMHEIAKAEVAELNNLLTGRFLNAMGVIFSKITWDKDYKVRSEDINLSHFALQSAVAALDKYKEIKLEENKNFEKRALNAVLFYTVLTKAGAATESESREALRQADQLKTSQGFEENTDFINTFALVCITFSKYLGDGTASSILEKFSDIERLLKKSLNKNDLPPDLRYETSQMLSRLYNAQLEVQNNLKK